jgi:hypothetical protein
VPTSPPGRNSPTTSRNTPRIRQTLQHWQKGPDLAGIRDPDGIAALPADEQEACKKLWADVAALLKKVGQAK